MFEGIEPFLGDGVDAEVGEEEEAGEVVGGVSSEAAVVEVDAAGGGVVGDVFAAAVEFCEDVRGDLHGFRVGVGALVYPGDGVAVVPIIERPAVRVALHEVGEVRVVGEVSLFHCSFFYLVVCMRTLIRRSFSSMILVSISFSFFRWATRSESRVGFSGLLYSVMFSFTPLTAVE